MDKGVFLSFRYWDNTVYKLHNKEGTIVKDYVDAIKGLFTNSRECWYREGKDKQDNSESGPESVEEFLSEKIFHTNTTIVLISSGMIDDADEKDS